MPSKRLDCLRKVLQVSAAACLMLRQPLFTRPVPMIHHVNRSLDFGWNITAFISWPLFCRQMWPSGWNLTRHVDREICPRRQHYSAVVSAFSQSASLSIRFGTLRFAFTPCSWSPLFDGYGVKKQSEKGVQSMAFPSALFGAPFSHWQLHHRKLRLLAKMCLENTSRGSSGPRTSNMAFVTPGSNNAALEHSHQAALIFLSKRLWRCTFGLM